MMAEILPSNIIFIAVKLRDGTEANKLTVRSTQLRLVMETASHGGPHLVWPTIRQQSDTMVPHDFSGVIVTTPAVECRKYLPQLIDHLSGL